MPQIPHIVLFNDDQFRSIYKTNLRFGYFTRMSYMSQTIKKKRTSEEFRVCRVRRFFSLLLFLGIIIFFGLTLAGCGNPNTPVAPSYPYKLKFTVTNVFYKEIGDDPYSVLTFDLSNLDSKLGGGVPVQVGDLIYIKLLNLNGVAKPVSYTEDFPNRGIFAEARVAYVYTNSILVSYAFDTVKLPKSTSRNPSAIVGANVKLSTNGTGIVDSLVYKI